MPGGVECAKICGMCQEGGVLRGVVCAGSCGVLRCVVCAKRCGMLRGVVCAKRCGVY